MATTTNSTASRGDALQARETRDVERYLYALMGREQARSLIEVRYRYHGGMRQRFLAHADLFTAARTIVRLGIRSDVYVGVAPRQRRSGDKAAIDRIWVLWADLDTPDAHQALHGLPVAPAVLIASGTPGHLHAYWPLSTPATVTQAEAANRRLAAQLHADTGAVTNAATILRPPGTYSFKTSPPTPVVLEQLLDTTTTLQLVTAGIARDPAPIAAQARGAAPERSPRRPRCDPLRDVAPAVYVSALTGQQVPRSHKVSCPLHEDRTPSLHVYDTPAEGWYCYGCQRGGSIYDLGAAIYDLTPRGDEFLELRRRLHEALGAWAPATHD